MKTMYVSNLPPDTTEDEIRYLFSQYGTVRALFYFYAETAHHGKDLLNLSL